MKEAVLKIVREHPGWTGVQIHRELTRQSWAGWRGARGNGLKVEHFATRIPTFRANR